MYRLSATKSTRVVQKVSKSDQKFRKYLVGISVVIVVLLVLGISILLAIYSKSNKEVTVYKDIPNTVDLSKLPKNFPAYVPIYPNGDIQVSTYELNQIYMEEITTDNPKIIIDWYKKVFSDMDWKIAQINDYRLEINTNNKSGFVFVEKMEDGKYSISLSIGDMEIKREIIEREVKTEDIEKRLNEFNKLESKEIDF